MKLTDKRIAEIKIELNEAKDHFDFTFLAEEVAESGDKNWATEIYNNSINVAKNWNELNKSFSCINELENLESLTSNQYLEALRHLSNIPEGRRYSLVQLAEHIQENLNDKDLIKKVYLSYLDNDIESSWEFSLFLENLEEMSENFDEEEWSVEIIQRIEELDNAKIDRSDIAAYVCRVFDDKKWGKSLYEKEISSDYISCSLAESIYENLGDKVWAKELYKKLEKEGAISADFKDNLCLAESIFDTLGDEKWAGRIYDFTESLIKTPEDFRSLADSLATNLEQFDRAKELKKKGTFEIKNLDGMWGYRREGFGRIVYFSIGYVDFNAIQQVVDHIYTETVEDEDGDEVQDWSEYDPSKISTDLAGDLEDSYSLDELINNTKLKDTEGSDVEKLGSLCKELEENGCTLVLIDTKNDDGPCISTLKTEDVKKTFNKHKKEIHIYVREYDHVGDY